MASGKYHRETYINVVDVRDDFLKLVHQSRDFMDAPYAQTRNRMSIYLTSYTTITVSESLRAAPDLISFQSYQTTDLWWVIALFNGIVNPLTEIVPGLELKIPSIAQVDALLTALKKDGNARSTKTFTAKTRIIN